MRPWGAGISHPKHAPGHLSPRAVGPKPPSTRRLGVQEWSGGQSDIYQDSKSAPFRFFSDRLNPIWDAFEQFELWRPVALLEFRVIRCQSQRSKARHFGLFWAGDPWPF